MNFNEEQVRKTIAYMKPNGQIFEVRVKYKDKKVYSGYFQDADTLVSEMKKLPNAENNAYITLNELHDACMTRTQSNRFVLKTEAQTSDSDVIGYDWLLIDLDPKRPSETSSSGEEFEYAKNKCNVVYKFMEQIGFYKPLICVSGNGYHLLYKINLERNEENKQLIKDCLNTLDMLFSDENVEVDTTVFNPSRITKLYGTLAQKGKSTENRPHRLSKILNDDEVKNNSKTYLRALVSCAPKIDKPQRYNNFNAREFDIEEWMNKYGIQYRKSGWNGGDKYVLDHCPFDYNHKSPDSAIFKTRDGACGFRCLHNSCAGKTWKDVRVMFEPDAYEKKWKEQEQKMYRTFNRDRVKESNPIVEKENAPIFFTSKDIYNMPHVEETFVKTGVVGIDRKVRGLKKGFCSLWSGLRGSAKSTILSQIILNAVDEGNNVACFSGELAPRNFMRWMNLQAAGKSNVKEGQYEGYYYVSKETQEKIAEWMENSFWLYNNDYGNDSKAVLELFDKTIKEKKLDLLILDNLMAFDLSTLNESKWEAQKDFIWELHRIAQKHEVHIALVAHPRKAMGFLRLDDISGSSDLTNAVEYAFIVHRNNNDFKRLTQQMFGWRESDPIYECTNVIEICKDRDGGTQDYFVPLWYEFETKRLKNDKTENVIYGWNTDEDGFASIEEMELSFE